MLANIKIDAIDPKYIQGSPPKVPKNKKGPSELLESHPIFKLVCVSVCSHVVNCLKFSLQPQNHSPCHCKASFSKYHNRDSKTHFSLNLSFTPSWNLKL